MLEGALLMKRIILTILMISVLINALITISYAESEAELLARLLYTECRGEDEKGQLAVAQCVIDRRDTNHNDFKKQDTIKKVITAKNQFAKPGKLTDELLAIAQRAIDGERAYPHHEVLFFRKTKKTGDWWTPYIGEIGKHKFYGCKR